MKTNHKPSVLFINRHYPPRYTGDGKFLNILTSHLADLGHNVNVLCEKADGDWVEPESVRVERLPVFRIDNRIANIWFSLVASMSLRTRYKTSSDIVVTVINPFFIPVYKTIRSLGKSAVCRTTLYGSDDGISLQHSKLGKLLLKSLFEVDAIVCVTDLFRDSFLEIGLDASRLALIPYAVDTDFYHPISSKEKETLRLNLGIQGDPLVVYVGGIVPRKGIDLLVSAWKNVLDRWPEAHLILVGPMHLELERQKKYIEEIRAYLNSYLGLATVTFVGEVEDPSPYVKACDLFVFPTRQEGFGMAMIEAMACRKPVVSTQFIGYSPFLGRHLNELFLVNPELKALERGLCEVIANPSLQSHLAESAYKKVYTRFSFKIVAKAYSELFTLLYESKG